MICLDCFTICLDCYVLGFRLAVSLAHSYGHLAFVLYVFLGVAVLSGMYIIAAIPAIEPCCIHF